MEKGKPKVPPSVPRSVMVPFSQRNGSVVGSPVTGFTVEFVNEHPTTCPLSLIVMFPQGGESGPPKVPRSCIPCCLSHRNVRIWVPKKGSDTRFEANPVTWPPLFTMRPTLSYPPPIVPKSLIWVPVQRTARFSGN